MTVLHGTQAWDTGTVLLSPWDTGTVLLSPWDTGTVLLSRTVKIKVRFCSTGLIFGLFNQLGQENRPRVPGCPCTGVGQENRPRVPANYGDALQAPGLLIFQEQ